MSNDIKNIKVKKGDKKLTASEIKRSIRIFSLLCSIFILIVGFFFSYQFLNFNNTLAVIILSMFIATSFLINKKIYNFGVRRTGKKYPWLLNELMTVEIKSKKIITLSLLTIISPIIFFVIFILVLVPNIDVVEADVIILGAHRGNSVDYIENTLPAFQDAVDNDRYKFIEFDVQYTKDKQIVVHHDLTLWRLQGKKNRISELTYEELNNISDYHIPLYSEVMEIVAGKKPLNIEIKSQGNLSDDEMLSDFVITDSKERGIFESILFSSISSDILEYIAEEHSEAKTGKIYWIDESSFLNFDSFTSSMYLEMEMINADYLMLHGSNIRNYYSLKRTKPENYTIVFWYFTDEIYIIGSNPSNWISEFTEPTIGGKSIWERIKEKINARNWVLKFGKKEIVHSNKEVCAWWCV